jgi:hypothetical protein
VLVSLPYSHYVELARWSLCVRKNAFSEIKVPIGPHMLVAALYRLAFPGGTSSCSSFPGDPTHLSSKHTEHWWFPRQLRLSWLRRISGVPLVIVGAPDGATARCVPDSWGALTELAGLEIDAETKVRFDHVVGPRVRQAAYHHIFAERMELYYRVQSCGPTLMALCRLIERVFRVTDSMKALMEMTPDVVAEGEQELRVEFGHVGAVLERHAYLGAGAGGDTFGGADLAWSALVGWLVLPPKFHGGAVDVPSLEDFPPSCQRLVREFRDTPAGRHVVHCYETYR